MEREHEQRRTYSTADPTSVARAASGGGNRSWASSHTISGTAITVNLRNGYEESYQIPRLDALQSPLPETELAEREIAAKINNKIEADIYAYLTGLASVSLTGTPTATANGNAGSVRKRAEVTNQTISISGKHAVSTQLGADGIMDVIDDFVLRAKRANLIDGSTLYGDTPGMLYMIMAPELFKYHVVNRLRAQGLSLDPLTSDTLKRSSVFSTDAFVGKLGVEGLTIVCPNVATVPASAGDNWKIVAGYSNAVLGGIGPIFTQLISPEQNQDGDGWVVRVVVNPFYNLFNGDGIYIYEINSVA